MKYLSTFTGVGGFELGFPKEWECIGFSEKDKYCSELLNKKFPNVKNYGDITKINSKDLPDFDLLCGGFPCQDVSLAGKRDLTKGRSMLVNDVFRIIKEKQPKYVILENVKGLLSMKDFWNSIRWTLKNLGYGVLYKVLNSKDYGVPQNRERIYIICKKGGWNFMEYQYPEEQEKVYLKNILEKGVDKKYYLSDIQVNKIIRKHGEYESNLNNIYDTKDSKPEIGQAERRYGINGFIPSLNNWSPILKVHSLYPRSGNPKKGGTGHLSKDGNETYALNTGNMQCLEEVKVRKIINNKNKRSERQDGNSFTLTGSGRNVGSNQCIETSPTITTELAHSTGKDWNAERFSKVTGELRRLTPIECERLQGFPDNWTEGFSDTQRYKMMGNAVTVNVTRAVLKNIG